ncbi:MAG: hypothetical protein U9N49_13145 [Campylobacterota bacterium]|nr:hypothetical protein [Campylobacterota bacterium]
MHDTFEVVEKEIGNVIEISEAIAMWKMLIVIEKNLISIYNRDIFKRRIMASIKSWVKSTAHYPFQNIYNQNQTLTVRRDAPYGNGSIF